MKKLILAAFSFLLFIPLAQGQSNAEEVEYFQSLFGGEKKYIVSSFIQLEGEANEAFWTLYDEYETERKTLGKNRIALMEKYAKNYDGISDEETDGMMKDWSKQIKSLNKLVETYYKKVRKVTGSKTAAQFYHLEHYFMSAIRLSVLESIPVIGELGN